MRDVVVVEVLVLEDSELLFSIWKEKKVFKFALLNTSKFSLPVATTTSSSLNCASRKLRSVYCSYLTSLTRTVELSH